MAGRWNSVNTLGYTAPGDDKQIRVNFSGYLEKTSDGRLRKSSYSYISFSEILLGDGNSKVLSGGKITERDWGATHLDEKQMSDTRLADAAIEALATLIADKFHEDDQ